ncbi:MAG: cation:dicarboxylase symporter family transporter, partial [Arcobacteraceae bacterium]
MIKELLEKLWFQVIVGMFLGIGVGLLLSPTAFALVPENIAFAIAPWVALVGNIFLALIQMIVVPLV